MLEKEFKTIEEQIDILKSRNLIINNIENAYEILQNNNYYYLINGYKNLFIDKTIQNERFIENAKIEEIYSLYEFDRKIRIIFLENILLIERKIDTYIAYEFSKEYGHRDYLIPSNFNLNQKNYDNINKLIKEVNKDIIHQYKNENKMIRHYLDTYSYIPLWVLIRILSFGKVSKFYSFMKPKDQNNISRKFYLKSNVLKVFLTNLGEVRNVCAHDEKLYDIKLRFKISSNEYHNILKLKKYKGNYINGVKDLFSIVIILKLLLKEDEFKIFYKKIINNIERLRVEIQCIDFEIILDKMGFPKNYKKLLNLAKTIDNC